MERVFLARGTDSGELQADSALGVQGCPSGHHWPPECVRGEPRLWLETEDCPLDLLRRTRATSGLEHTLVMMSLPSAHGCFVLLQISLLCLRTKLL